MHGVEVVLVSRENFLLFTPMLHEVAGSDVGVTDIVQPLRKMLRHTQIDVAEVEAIDLEQKQVRLTRREFPNPLTLGYDQLVLALGSVTNFRHVPGLEDARGDDEDAGRRHRRAQSRHRRARTRRRPDAMTRIARPRSPWWWRAPALRASRPPAR